jgi:cell wall-associated NlpC family hydrolase
MSLLPVLIAVHIASAVGDAPADLAPKHARADERVTLYAVVVVKVGEKTVVYSEAPELRVAGLTARPRPLAEAGSLRLSWFKVEPTVENMSNEASGAFRYETIPYDETEVEAWRDRGAVRADVHPTLTPDRGGGLGTMRYKLVASRGGLSRATPGVEAKRGKGAGGLAESVHRVSIRRDDSYLGWLTEMYGQPYIWASAGANAKTHQSERLEGADCADFVTYGWRRLGHDVPYTWTGGLPKLTRKLAAGQLAADGVVRDGRGRPVAFTKPGDLVLFPRHVGVLVRDAGQIGVLDADDVIVHALFASPHEVRLADSGYGDRPLELRRWK